MNPAPPKTDASFPVIGIAASAGGLEAFTELISHLPADTGMAFVLIQHLSPNYESLLPEIIGRITPMPVHQAEEGMPVEPNQVYVIPPGTQMTIAHGRLHLSPRQKTEGKYHPADLFFESLAADRDSKAIAVVLSGIDGDGSHGLGAIKLAGGLTFAQCEGTAKFDGMPNTAVATGNVDFVLPPQAIAEQLATFSRKPSLFNSKPLQFVKQVTEPGDALTRIFALLRTTTGVDFTAYKPTTLNRRIQRRMLLYKFETLEDYAQYLQDHPNEVQALYEEILIHVTHFFRDPEIFEQLKTQVFPTISQNKTAETPIRLWIAGCSTGEEVYSIAICLLEYFNDQATLPPIQIFSTDISESALNKARTGIYLDNQMEGVSPERRMRFFVPLASGGYQISSAIRELCVFARHNLGGDPPFSNLDLISCRNVLIYLSEPLQERIMSLFHYSLNLTGFLFLGTSESVKTASDLFTPIDEAAKIYARKLSLSRSLFSFTTPPFPLSNVNRQQRITETIAKSSDLAREVDQLIANRYAPVSVVVDEQMQILSMRGDTNPYLQLTPGSTELNLLQMAREGLSITLRTAIYQAQTQNISIRQEHLQTESDQPTLLNLEVIPFQPAIANTLYFLVIFEEISSPVTPLTSIPSERREPEELEREIVRLRQALAVATQRELTVQAQLQAVIQEQNYLNQSLRVANEEILSSNEELQSTNEELQTAKEEIQATNEELSTTNDELRSRNFRQNRDNSDLNNFIDSINVPILMLTNDLRIRRFTPAAQRLFNFIAADAGRPFNDFRTDFDVSSLEAMALEVLDTLNTKEQEIQTESGYWYMLRIRPYRTTENQIDGVTMVFLDIDALKRHAEILEAERSYAELIIETVQIPLVILDADLRVSKVNRSFYETFQVSPSETVPASFSEFTNGQWDFAELRSMLEAVLTQDRPIHNFEVSRTFERIGQKIMLLNACKLQRDGGADMILLSIEDVTEREQLERERFARQQAEADNRMKDDFLSNLSHELRNPLNTMLGWATMLRNHTHSETVIDRASAAIDRSARMQSQLIEDLLDISRITSGKINLSRRWIDVRLGVEAAIESVQLSAAAKNIQIVSDLEPAIVLGDVDRLQQVIWNLLSNAIKFTRAGGQVKVTLTSTETEAQIQVSDTGRGIRADLLPYIFDRFRQGDSSTTKAEAGLGLGLSIVRHLVELHGGTVQAESPGEGQGAIFTVRLPLQNVSSEIAPSRLTPSWSTSTNNTVEPVLDGLCILTVDDERDTGDLCKLALEMYGAKVQNVYSAREALSALRANADRYDVMICDIGMPEYDGYWLIREIRSLDAGRQIPVVALTAYASENERQRAIEAGFQMHIPKPVEPIQLAVAIATLARPN
ncbi:chemotaxis protein CheB [Leptolyngbya sp. FACHB-17]|uniref:chemotaxis protein CheB n=1 Tax=unclassified Leptolyngbya TaxID=2650499 RepID=UPI0016815401|nr:PAS domain-containing protein [Leptolyngbya sp. FACHB-17]